jgi:hypothetical protein
MRRLLLLLLLVSPAAADTFVVEPNPFVLGQAVDWLDDTHVVWHDSFVRDEDADGTFQIYRSTLDGGDRTCLTCGLQGPNQVPAVRPGGEWILFHSWVGHQVTLGAPGFGGIGADVWVMRADGSQRTNLTRTGELYDNFHAYWSPDGTHIVWTKLSWNAEEGGNGRSDIRVARFDPAGPNGPRLVGEHIVRPGNGHWYETQWWAPDGSGFLYTETVERAINPELFFCRLPNRDAGGCRQRTRLTFDPAWDEQAIFTPDMNRILFMSSRDLPGAHNDWVMTAELLDLPATYDYQLILFVFFDSFIQPVLEQATDLYEIELDWNAARTRFKPGRLRRLTRSGLEGWVIPEFAWDPSGRRLLWSEAKFNDGRRVDQGCVQRFLREQFVARMRGISTIDKIPYGIATEMRQASSQLLRDPQLFDGSGLGCGGEDPEQVPAMTQRTRIGRYVP